MGLVASLANLYLWQLSIFHQKAYSMGKFRGNLFQDFSAFYLSFDKYWFGEKDPQMVKIRNQFFFRILFILYGYRPWPGGAL